MSANTKISNVWTGTNGELWINNTDRMLRVQKFSFKQTNKYEKIDDTDNFAVQERLVAVELSGEIIKFKVDFGLNDIFEKYKNKQQVEITLTGKVENPDTGEAKRISITGITLQDFEIFGFEKGKVNQDTIAFNAMDYSYL